MFKPRKTNEGISTLLFWKGHPFTFDGLVGQCTWYVLGRVAEVLGYPMNNWEDSPNCCPNKCWTYTGALDAKYWINNTNWKVSKFPQVCSVIVLDGNRGHVAFVEEDFGNGIYGISQYNKNSDRKFHYEKVNLNANSLYGMKILGYLIVPYEETKKDDSKWQIKVKVNDLRMRTDHSTNADIVCFAKNGSYYNIVDVYNGDYRWLKTEEGFWIATKKEWVDEYLPNEESELKKVNQTLKEMNKVLDEENKRLRDKLEKIGGILNE